MVLLLNMTICYEKNSNYAKIIEALSFNLFQLNLN